MPARKKQVERKHAIYALLDPVSRDVRYIGKSVSPRERYAEHIRRKSSQKYPVSRWAHGLVKRGTPPKMHILEWTSDWKTDEQKWIVFAREEGCDLLNIAAGGLDMAHVSASNKAYRAYIFLLRKLGSMGLKEKAAAVRVKAAAIRADHGEKGMALFNADLRNWCREHQPLCAGAR